MARKEQKGDIGWIVHYDGLPQCRRAAQPPQPPPQPTPQPAAAAANRKVSRQRAASAPPAGRQRPVHPSKKKKSGPFKKFPAPQTNDKLLRLPLLQKKNINVISTSVHCRPIPS